MIIPTKYVIISQVNNGGEEMVHVLSYHKYASQSHKEWYHQIGLKTTKTPNIMECLSISIEME